MQKKGNTMPFWVVSVSTNVFRLHQITVSIPK